MTFESEWCIHSVIDLIKTYGKKEVFQSAMRSKVFLLLSFDISDDIIEEAKSEPYMDLNKTESFQKIISFESDILNA